MYLLLYPIYVELYGPLLANWISISNFGYITTVKPRVSVESIGKEVPALPPSWPILTAIVLPILKQLYKIGSYSSHV